MMISLAILIFGSLLLAKGAELFVKGGENIGFKLGLSPTVIGLTIIAFGTSAPELFVNLLALKEGKELIILGNILGSNIANLLLILGTAAIIKPTKINPAEIKRELTLSGLLVVILALGVWLSPSTQVTRLLGIIFLLIFGWFLKTSVTSQNLPIPEEQTSDSTTSSTVKLIIGLALLPIGAKLIISSATHLAVGFGISEAVVSLIAVAIGTSLPELATSVLAALKNKNELIAGNVFGSNIFNIALILGICAVISPFPFHPNFYLDSALIILITMAVFGISAINKRHELTRLPGALLLLSYAVYTYFQNGRLF